MRSILLFCGLLLVHPPQTFVFGVPITSKSNLTNQNNSSATSIAPLEFPKNESNYPFMHNNTVLEKLASQTDNDTEVNDLLRGGFSSHLQGLLQTEGIGEEPKVAEVIYQAELIKNGQENEDGNDPISSEFDRSSFPPSKNSFFDGGLAAILAGVFVIISVFGYIAMLSWRRFLENRYGHREMLVNEEDLFDPNDMRHFSVSDD